MTEVQAKADDGYFVVGVAQGIIKNGSMGAGHIVVVIPSGTGSLVAGDWSVPTPHTIDCGSGRRSDNTDLSVGFKNETTWANRIRSYYHK